MFKYLLAYLVAFVVLSVVSTALFTWTSMEFVWILDKPNHVEYQLWRSYVMMLAAFGPLHYHLKSKKDG